MISSATSGTGRSFEIVRSSMPTPDLRDLGGYRGLPVPYHPAMITPSGPVTGEA
jgi:hypothetical protein